MSRMSIKLVLFSLCLVGCSSTQQEQDTLRTLDVTNGEVATDEVFVKPKTEEEVKAAYYNYIKSAPAQDKTRLSAINRLAELEINRINNLVKNGDEESANSLEEEAIYQETLRRTVDLLKTSLGEYPDAKGNDKTLYQLARTLDQLGNADESMAYLKTLTEKYPESHYYAESQFRIGEQAFIQGDFLTAEGAYTEAILTAGNDSFYERSLFKRGWARYKQSLYTDAVDDYIAALKQRNFGDYESLSSSDKDQFDEFFRAIGLSFANLQNAETLQSYFSNEEDFKYLYHTYSVVTDIYLKQERYSDAADTLAQFIASNPDSPKIPLAKLKTIEIWKKGKFKERAQDALDKFYVEYQPKSIYWQSEKMADTKKQVSESLREYILLISSYHQESYQKNKKQEHFTQANIWYQRYLEHFTTYARQDKVYTLYAELLAAENRNIDALKYFELAAYDDEIILNKEAAYATIVLADKLHQQETQNPLWIDKQINYSLKSAELYSKEARYQTAALNAAELAFKQERFSKAIELTNTLSTSNNEKLLYEADTLKGMAHQKLGNYSEAETIFAALAKENISNIEKKKQQDNLALVIYTQAKQELEKNNTEAAIQHYARVAYQAAQSDIAPKSLYEAIALSMQYQQWNNAISYIQQFQKMYPDHELHKDATKQLSTAYLNSGQGVKAAQAFEKISAQEQNQDVKMAALWKAAELYDSKNDMDAAIRAYKTYSSTYTSPYPQYLEAMYKLTKIYQKQKDVKNAMIWQEKIVSADKQTAKSSKNERTNFIAANTVLELATAKLSQFSQARLIEPLATSLRVKKKLMQDAIALYGQASSYNYTDITTQSTFAIGGIYQEFSKALMNSERPKNLSDDELEQYNILIEDQAFPFEEKAIEFYEINLARISDGTSNEWINRSYKELTLLFPVRYNRKGKVSAYE